MLGTILAKIGPQDMALVRIEIGERFHLIGIAKLEMYFIWSDSLMCSV